MRPSLNGLYPRFASASRPSEALGSESRRRSLHDYNSHFLDQRMPRQANRPFAWGWAPRLTPGYECDLRPAVPVAAGSHPRGGCRIFEPVGTDRVHRTDRRGRGRSVHLSRLMHHRSSVLSRDRFSMAARTDVRRLGPVAGDSLDAPAAAGITPRSSRSGSIRRTSGTSEAEPLGPAVRGFRTIV